MWSRYGSVRPIDQENTLLVHLSAKWGLSFHHQMDMPPRTIVASSHPQSKHPFCPQLKLVISVPFFTPNSAEHAPCQGPEGFPQ